MTPLVLTGNLNQSTLANQVAVVTGAGGGIGFEAARALAWLGAKVIIAEISLSGKNAEHQINNELAKQSAIYVRTDVGSERSVQRLAKKVRRVWEKVDIVLNNATIAPLGGIGDLPIRIWDTSYRVNLRGPVLLAQAFLPGMIKRNQGTFVCVGSEGLAYMGAYETQKAAQMHLAHTIDAEIEKTAINCFTVGPGMVPTATAKAGIAKLARLWGKPLTELEAMVEEHSISVEAAGAGLAAAIALANHFRGEEIGVKQALKMAQIEIGGDNGQPNLKVSPQQLVASLQLCQEVRHTIKEQYEGWQQRSVFERQWISREFRKSAGMPVEQWLAVLDELEKCIKSQDVQSIAGLDVPLSKLITFYKRQQTLAKGYIKDHSELDRSLNTIGQWQKSVEELADSLGLPR